MRVLVLGATGYLGAAITQRLLSYDHEVISASRSVTRPSAHAGVVHADLTKPDTLGALVTDDIDAVVHAAAPTGDWDLDRRAVAALMEPLRSSGRPFVYISGVWVLGRTDDGDEFSRPDPITLVSGREGVEAIVRESASQGIRAMVIRPGIVHGDDGGIPALLVSWAHRDGVGRYVGSSATRWPMVHRDDLGRLVVLAIESGPAGAVLHAVAEPGVPVRELARSADRAAGGQGHATAWEAAQAARALGGAFTEALALDQHVVAPAARALGWVPAGPTAVDDVESYSLQA